MENVGVHNDVQELAMLAYHRHQPVLCLTPHSTRNCRWAADLARGGEWTQKFWRKFKWIL